MILVFDGGSKDHNNTKHGYGSFKLFHRGESITWVGFDFGLGISNVSAEYLTLLQSLQYIRTHYSRQSYLDILGDSQTVQKQVGNFVNGKWIAEYEVRAMHLLPHRDTIRTLLREFDDFCYQYIPDRMIKTILGH